MILQQQCQSVPQDCSTYLAETPQSPALAADHPQLVIVALAGSTIAAALRAAAAVATAVVPVHLQHS